MVLDFAKEVIGNQQRLAKLEKIHSINKLIDASSWSDESLDAFILGYTLAKGEQ